MPSILNKNWKYVEEKKYPEELLEVCGSRVLARLLANRGITDISEAKAFLNISENPFSSPYEFEDMEKAVERLQKAITDQEHIVIYGDFDADGVTSTSIFLKTFKHLNANVSYYIPDRMTESHGLNSGALCRLISSRQAKLIITCDCGISGYKEVSLANSFKVDVIITDHHELPENIPEAYAVISTKLLSPSSKMIHMAGAGVAYKVSEALLEASNKKDFLDEILYLSAIGTIADLVPLLQENRLIAYHGLKKIEEKEPAALREIVKNASLKLEPPIKSELISFCIAPRLNALGRLDNASLAVELLTTDNQETIELLAAKMEELNKKRQYMVDKIFEEIKKELTGVDLNQNNAIIMADRNWHPGIIGLVASKLVEHYYKPAFIMNITGEDLRGSARSIEGIHLFEVLNKHNDLFTKFGGHEMAAGFNFHISKLDLFKELISKEINECLKDRQPIQTILIEIDVAADEINDKLIEKLDKLSPYGQNNPAPILSCSELSVLNFKTIGSNNNHLRLYFKDPANKTFEAVWWQQSNLPISPLTPVRVAFNPEINVFMNKSRLQLVVNDIMSLSDEISGPKLVKNTIKWIDHRNKSDISSFINNLMKVTDNQISVFAESINFIDHKKFNCSFINRLNLEEKIDQLVIYEYPPLKEVITQLIQKHRPDIIHLAPFNMNQNYSETDIIKSVRGMLKYAQSNKNSEADINQMASKLGTSNEVIKAAIDLFIAAKDINIYSFKNDIITFDFKEKLSSIDMFALPENNRLKEELEKVKQFRQELLTKNIEEFLYL